MNKRPRRKKFPPKKCTNCKLSNSLKLILRWTFWYVYTISHREKKKLKIRSRQNEYTLNEVFSFGTVGAPD